ncbi:MAG: glycosyltransferase family 2 protein [Pseudomonadota bacterium]
MSEQNIRLAVVICTIGRPECVQPMLGYLRGQTRRPDRIVFAVTRSEDVGIDPGGEATLGSDVEVVYGPKGLPKQRNVGLDAVSGAYDLLVFFDDDYVPSRNALAGIEAAFDLWPDVNGMTGDLIADGIHGAGFTAAQAEKMVATYDSHTKTPTEGRVPVVIRDGLAGLYGCNMAYRVSALGSARFDEALPLYGWQEDIDFAAQIPGGRIKTDAFAGVHRGAKSGRETAGRRLGYSQLANTWYLVRKGTMKPRFALRLGVRNFAANHIKMLRPEPWVDRKGRARGNWLALWDIMRGRADPGRILDL